MQIILEKVLEETLSLPADKHASIADKLLASLDTPDPAIDHFWREEAEARISATQRGDMEIIPEEDAFRKYRKGTP